MKKSHILIYIIIILIVFILCIKLYENNKSIESLGKIEEKTISTQNEIINEQVNIDKRINQWELLLVNSENKISEDYNIELEKIETNQYVDIRIAKNLRNMLNDARKLGLDPIICSSYRTMEKQTELYNKKVKEYIKRGYGNKKAKEIAAKWVAMPGTSEHQTGLAVDIVSKKYQILNEKQADTKTQQWLMENCYNYGFILRYPREKNNITKITYEPWHYRYVGIENAKEIKEKNLCLEEYIQYLKNGR